MNDELRQRIMSILLIDPEMILMIKNKYIDEKLWEFSLDQDPSLFKYVEEPSQSLCNYAIELDGNNLIYILKNHENITITREMRYKAIENCPKVLLQMPSYMIDEGLKELAFDRDPALLQYFDKIRPEYLSDRLCKTPSIIRYIKNIDEDLICKTLIDEPNIILYFDDVTPKMMDFIEKYHPHYLPLINKGNRDSL